MSKIYNVKKISNNQCLVKCKEINIDNNNWDIAYSPKSIAKIGYDDNGIYVFMSSYEDNIRYTLKERNSDVYTDSCLEFFFMPLVNNNDKYINFEINPLGTMLTAVGKNRDTREFFYDGDSSYFKMETEIKDNYWNLSYYIPESLIAKYIDGFTIQKGINIKANFFKCGDKSNIAHFLSWTKIETPSPDFHRPEFFGTLIFE